MTAVRALGPGSSVPGWAEALESGEFASAWGPLGESEILWLMDDSAFARWRVAPGIGEAELLRVAVVQAHRRSGVAKRLMAACSEYLAASGCTSLHLEVRASNAPAQKLYESLGWRRTGTRKAYYGDGEGALVYALELPPAHDGNRATRVF
jgi:ribosomal protein S18 acetylase RimI-like enzyme